MRKDEQTDGQTDMTKLIVAFRNFANALKRCTDIIGLMCHSVVPSIYTCILASGYHVVFHGLLKAVSVGGSFMLGRSSERKHYEVSYTYICTNRRQSAY